MNKHVASKILWLVPLAWAPGACSTDGPVDIGHNVAELSDFAASWDGYAEAASFPKSGSDRVRLILHPNGEGTLELGDAAPVPPPTRAEGGYLLSGVGGSEGSVDDAFRDGFKYPVHEARVEVGRIRFGISPLDLYGAWCALVPPVPNEQAASGYACGSSSGGKSSMPEDCFFSYPGADPMVFDQVPVDCGIFDLCVGGIGGRTCTCTASACGARVTPTDGVSLDGYSVVVDAALDPGGTTLVGTLVIKDGPSKVDRITIRMLKTP
jgi:hypothetical protein